MKRYPKRLLAIALMGAMLLPLLCLPVNASSTVYEEMDFEGFASGATLTTADGFAATTPYNSVMSEGENNYVRIPLLGTCTATSSGSFSGNVDQSLQVSNDKIYATDGNFVIEASYRPHWIDVSETRGYVASKTEDPTIQCQLRTVEAGINPNEGKNLSFRGLYKINLRTGHLSIMGTHTGAAGLVQDQWNTVKLVIDPQNGVYDTYVNGVLYATDGYFGGDANTDQGLRNVNIPEGKIIIAKCNKNVGAYVDPETEADSSYMDVDNVRVYATKEKLTVRPVCDVDFERFSDGKVLATSDGFAAVTPYNEIKTEGDNSYVHIPYLGKCVVASGSGNEGNPDKALRMSHAAIPYTKGSFVVEASYRLHYEDVSSLVDYTDKSEDPSVQCQFYTISAETAPEGANTNYRGMYKINLRTGNLSGMGTHTGAAGLVQDEWNTVKLIIDPVNATYDTYVNGVLYATQGYFGGDSNEDSGFRNITINADSLIIAKCNKNVGAFVDDADADVYSYVDVDDVSITFLPEVDVTVDGKEMTVYESSRISFLREGRTFLYATVTPKDGESYVTYDTSIAAEDGMSVETFSVDFAAHSASLRLGEKMGLRFVSKINTEDYAALKNDPNVADIKLGTLIIPTLYKAISPQDLTSDAFPGLKTLHFPMEGENWYTGASVNGYHLMAASIVDIKEANYNYEFSGIGYMEIEMKDGAKFVLTTATAKSLVGVSVAKAATDALGTGLLDADTVAALAPYTSAYVADTTAQMKQDLSGLDVLAIGDSTFAGDEFGWEYQWINWMGADLGWNLTNLAYGGASISYREGQTQASMVNRLFNEAEFKFGGTNNNGNPWRYSTEGAIGKSAEEVDLILLSAGFNDYGGSGLYAQVGDMTLENRDTETFIGAWNVLLDEMLKRYPNAKIVIVNQWHLDTAYAGASRGDTITCYEFTNTVADMYNMFYHENDRIFLMDSGDPDISGVYMMDPAFRQENSRTPGDCFHLNQKGMEKMKTAVLPYIWNYVFRDLKAE